MPTSASVRGEYRPNVPTDQQVRDLSRTIWVPTWISAMRRSCARVPGGRSVIVIGQKDGHAWALDPDKKGEVVWSLQVGRGLETGGGAIMWGSAADNDTGYFLVTRTAACPGAGGGAPRDRRAGLARFSTRWRRRAGHGDPRRRFRRVRAPARCTPTPRPTARRCGSTTPRVTFETVNGVPAKGGNMSSAGPVVAGGMVFVPSGYSDLGSACAGTCSSLSDRSKAVDRRPRWTMTRAHTTPRGAR